MTVEKGKGPGVEERDAARDAKRDDARDAVRDGARDARRDNARDAKRDDARDAVRDENQDAELNYAKGVGWTDGPLVARDDDPRHQLEAGPDTHRHGAHDAHRDGAPEGMVDARQGATRGAQQEGTAASSTSPSTYDDRSLTMAMAEQCGQLIAAASKPLAPLPASLQLKHLAWMCRQVQEHSEAWATTKLHRWVGFIQAGIIANGLVRLEGAQKMFDELRTSQSAVDQDLLDHLNPEDSFELDIGGQG